MWQKERLLNIAISNIPSEATYVIWMDCDTIYAGIRWIENVKAALDQFPLIQAYSSFYDLKKDILLEDFKSDYYREGPTGYSMAYLNRFNDWKTELFQPKESIVMRRNLFGLSWAARKDLLVKHGFYDAMILGSGDRAMACAGWGRFEDFVIAMKLNKCRSDHYYRWAKPFYDDVQGKIGFIREKLFHYWHGDIKERRYLERHIDFSTFDFDPDNDIVLNQSKTWSWNTDKKMMQEFIKKYFFLRNEDGVA
jgi:hypothetical protein